MKRVYILLACILTTVFVLAACGNKTTVTPESVSENDDAIVGTWEENFFHSGYVFDAAGTGQDTFWNLTFTYTAQGGVITITYDSDMYGIAEYTYTISGDTLSMTRKDDTGETFEYQRLGGSARPADNAPDETDENNSEEETSADEGDEN